MGADDEDEGLDEAVAAVDGAGRVVAATPRFRLLAGERGADPGVLSRLWAHAGQPGASAWLESLPLPGGMAQARCMRAGELVFVRLEDEPSGPGGAAAGAEGASGRAFRRLAEGMVHDARNALNALALHLAVIRERMDRPERAGERDQTMVRSAEAIAAAVSRLEVLLRRYLRFASPSPEPGEVELSELVSQAVEACGHDARRLGVQVQAELSARSPVAAPADTLTGAVLALVQMGLDRGRGGTLRIAVEAEGSQAVLSLESGPERRPADSEVSLDSIRGALQGVSAVMAEAANGVEVRLPLATPAR